jgi:thiol-disulfide isomerase/thioredoxin
LVLPKLHKDPQTVRTLNPGTLLLPGLMLMLILLIGTAARGDSQAEPSATVRPIDSALGSPPSLDGKVVYVDFWASWCTPCRASFPWLNRLSAEYKTKGLEVVTINLDRRHDAAVEFLDELEIDLQVVYDSTGSLAKLYDIDAMPTSYLYDRTGALQARHRGFSPGDTLSLRKTIVDLLNEKPE